MQSEEQTDDKLQEELEDLLSQQLNFFRAKKWTFFSLKEARQHICFNLRARITGEISHPCRAYVVRREGGAPINQMQLSPPRAGSSDGWLKEPFSKFPRGLTLF